jgi:hypothetical protein
MYGCADDQNRELARRIGVSETAVRRAEKAGRIRREPDGAWDLTRVQAAWSSNTNRAQHRRQHGAMKAEAVNNNPVVCREIGLKLTHFSAPEKVFATSSDANTADGGGIFLLLRRAKVNHARFACRDRIRASKPRTRR